MKTPVQIWGNSLALRIPKSFAEESGLCANSAVELSLSGGGLLFQPIATLKLTLDERQRCVTDEHLPSEWAIGPANGKEAW